MESSATAATMPRLFPTRVFHALLAGLGGVLAAALFLEAFDGGLPKPARAEVAALAAASSPGGLCFKGPGAEFLDFAPAGQGCR